MRRNVFGRLAGLPAAASGLVGLISPLRRFGRPVTAVAAAAFVLLAVNVTGVVEGSDSSLVIMGFDPDRARLITSLLVCAGAASFVYLCSERVVTAVLLGLGAGIALYVETFVQETSSAIVATGAAGVFDPGGWLLTLETLLLTGIVVAWSAATLSRPVRLALVSAGGALNRAARKGRAGPRSLTSPIIVAAVASLLLVSAPVLGDMLNYTPDAHMLAGRPEVPGLGGGPGAGPSAGSAPWLAWKPSGPGQVVYDQLPAPWVGGHTVNVSVYLPAGYGTGGRRYPVVYETVFSFATMDKAFNAKSEIDALIDDGQVPASIVVLIDTSGGPYLDSECANSTDGQEWMGTFIGETVPTYIDSHYLTIARRAARTVLGFSQGGYCAAILTLDYPNVFGNAVSFSGYFHAGLGSANAWRPFGHSQKILDQFSPTLVAPQLSAGTLAGLYFVLDYDPALLGDAREADGFVQVLRRSGYRYTVIASRQKHSWAQVREGLGPALALVGGRQAEEHIFS